MSKLMMTMVMVVAVALAAMPVVGQEVAAPAADAAVAPAAPAAPAVPAGMKVTLPFKVYGNADDEGEMAFVPSGYMGSNDNGASMEVDDSCTDNPHSGSTCIKVSFPDPRGWAGIAFQNPANNWGEQEGGVDLSGAKQLSFWARGDKGGEMVEFKMGVIGKNMPFWDTGKASLGKVKLDATWKQFIIPLAGKDLSRIITGFVFSMQGRTDGVTFYLDDIVYE